MLVATAVANDARVLKEATTLVEAGHHVHVIGKAVPTEWEPPAGVEVSSIGASEGLRPQGTASLSGRRLPLHVKVARWLLLPQHRNITFRRWAEAAEELGTLVPADVVHAHDFTALSAAARLAEWKNVPLVYDSHEFWPGRSREYRPTPVQDAWERRKEKALGAQAAAVITIGDGVASELRLCYGWQHITVVRNSFPRLPLPDPLPTPAGLVYAGRLGAYRELEVLARASEELELPVTAMGPSDASWLAGYARGKVDVVPPCTPDEVDAHLQRAGLVVVPLAPGWRNHDLALPNKLFHAVRAGVPVVATDIGELAKVVRTHGIGTLYRPGDADSLVAAVQEAVATYPELVRAVREAQDDLTWEADAARLRGVYDRIAADRYRGPVQRVEEGR